ncbi:unnamed protein product [Thelazia callipaeda]|uniref:HAP1 N-terminal domain-containing protein n=1 Tax=Thelazia callipaeda TaxID=103827 RepID=A0A0N5D488_THECL|nr:unnamed protein product [Thelazia callipaeda]
MLSRDGCNETKDENAVDLSGEDECMWKMKYEKLKEQYTVMKTRNEELEDRLLNLVEIVEKEKIMLADEVDRLNQSLVLAKNRVSTLENDCVRYKKDCALAVNLLQCKPSNYVQQEEISNISNNSTQKMVRNVATFPPMVVYFPDDPYSQKDDLVPHDDAEQASLPTSAAFTSKFVEEIKNNEHYRWCSNCDSSQVKMSRATQTA